MHCRKGIASVIGIAVFVSACASSSRIIQPAPPGPDARVRPADREATIVQEDPVERLIVYGAQTHSFPPPVLRSEYMVAQEEHRRAPGAYTRLRLASLLSCTRAPFRDDRRARELLAEAAGDAGAAEPVRSLATLWLRGLEERMALERALEDERRRRQALQNKLEQLKVIEEEIDRRPAMPVVPPAR